MKLIRAAGIALHRMQSAGLRSPVRTWVALGALLLSLAPAPWAQPSASGAAETADAHDPRPAPKAARGDPSRRAGKAGPAEGAGFAGRSDVRAFIDEMAATHDFDRATLTRAFRGARPLPAVIAAMDRPLLAPPKWYEYAPPLLAPARVDGGIAFLAAHRAALQRAEREYGVPPEIVVAIIGVETFYGANTGRHRTFDALATLAFDYPRRATFFRGELEHFLLLTRDLGADPLTPRGSFAGALGMPQFMPGSYRAYAVDFDADGRIDLWQSADDVIGSVAAYLARHDWQRGQPVLLPATAEGEGGAEGKKKFTGISMQSIAAQFRNIGQWEGILAARMIPYQLVKAVAWQKVMLEGKPSPPKKASKKEKEHHRKAIKGYAAVIASRLFPGHDFRRTVKCYTPHDGMVDAALIGEYCRRAWR